MFGTSIATTTVNGILDNIGSQSVNATVYIIEQYWPWFIIAAVIGIVIFLGKRLLHMR